jgi:spoIIIJ-associated protein
LSVHDADDNDLTPSDALRELLETLLEAFELEGEVAVAESDGVILGTIEGPDVEILVGDHGSVLDAIQHLAQRVALRGDGLRVRVDIGGYRGRREAELRAEADRAAERALAEGRAVALTPMLAVDRRVVHEHLRDREDIQTHSEGEEPQRRLIIEPA